MPAYLVGHITVRDQEKWKIYTDGVKRSLEPFHAEVVFRGNRHAVLSGRHEYDQAVVISFEDQAQLEKWYFSEAYQSLIPIRESAADVVIISYDTATIDANGAQH